MTIPLTLATFTGFLRDLDEEELAAFVADLWAETGWETSVEGTEVVAFREHQPEERQRLQVRADDRGPIDQLLGRDPGRPADVGDAVVLGYRRRGVEPEVRTVVDAEDLYDRLLFALDRETCRELCERHFGRAVEPAPDREGESEGVPLPLRFRTAIADRDNRHLVLASTAIAIVFLAAVVAGSPPGSGAGQVPADVVESEDVPTPVGGGFTPQEAVETATATADESSEERSSLIPVAWTVRDNVGAQATCNRTPRGVVEVFVTAARRTTANRTVRYRTMARFADSRIYPSEDEFDTTVRELRNGSSQVLFIFDQAFFGESRFVQDPNPTVDRLDKTTVVQEVIFVYEQERYVSEFVLTELQEGEQRGCWKIQSILHESPLTFSDDTFESTRNVTATPPSNATATPTSETNASREATVTTTPTNTTTNGTSTTETTGTTTAD